MSDINKKPAIRFQGFTDAWEQRKAVDIADYSKGNGYSKSDLTENGTPIILYGRLYTKYQFAIDEVDTFATPKDGSIYSQGNEVIIPASGETAEDIARASAVEKSGILLGGDLNILRPFNFINPLFLALTISNGEPQKELAKKAQGKSVVHIHNSDIQEVTVSFPTRAEQDQIVAVFRNLDNFITFHQRKYDKLKNIKKSMLEKMFPKNGSDVPEIRFKGFTDAWEQRKLETLADIRTGYPFDSEDFDESGEYLVITNGNIQNESEKVNPSVGNHIDITDSNLLTTYLLNIDDILVTMDGTVGRTAKVADEKLILAQRVGRLIPKINAEFLYQWLNTGKFFEDMKDLSHGGTIKHISLKEIGSYTAYLPKDEAEQVKIGNYFRNLDHLITLHQRKLEKLKNIKKSMLEKMFV
ncbi:MAG: restriction endonuclease subunit S [Ruminococcus sp.]|nr:restriction endonuclease subunit S [Ruminococcus sp.]